MGDLIKIIETSLPLVLAVVGLLQDSTLFDALINSGNLSEEDRKKITALRNSVKAEWDSMRPE